MSEQQTSLEIIAPTVEEAVEKGLAEFGLPSDEVDIEILDPGSRGLFGLGSRQARVRLTIRGMQVENSPAVLESSIPSERFEDELEPESDQMDEITFSDSENIPKMAEGDFIDEEEDEVLHACGDVVRDLLLRMKVRAQVEVHYSEPEDERSKQLVWVDIWGSDLSILIGPRAETLNALQYITGLIASKELGRTIPLVVDVEGFRARRSQQLRQLARRMADQAVKTGRRQVLEPMPANERRIIHIELRNNPSVTTESIGEDPRRKVTINPK